MGRRPGSEAEMAALFLRTELTSERWREDLQALLERAGLPEEVVPAVADRRIQPPREPFWGFRG